MTIPDNQMIQARRFQYSKEVSIYYEIEGEGHLPIVFLHGFANDLFVWSQIRKLFPRDKVAMYFLDLKGFGQSSKPKHSNYSLEAHADILISFLEHHQIIGSVLVGHSYGGGIALLGALKSMSLPRGQRSLIEKLVIIDGLCFEREFPLYASILRVPIAGTTILNTIPNRVKARFILERTFYNKSKISEELIDMHARAYAYPDVAYTIASSLDQVLPSNYETLVASYRSIDLSTLIIWGKDDTLIPVTHAVRLHENLPYSQLSLIANCGHTPHLEEPTETFNLISTFLNLQ